MTIGGGLQDGGCVSPKSRSKGTSARMRRGSDWVLEKITGTSIDSPKLDSLEARTTAILQQNWRGEREIRILSQKNTGADKRCISTQYFYFSDKNNFKKLSAAGSLFKF